MGDPGDQDSQEEEGVPSLPLPPQATSLPSSRERLWPPLHDSRGGREQGEGGNTDVE